MGTVAVSDVGSDLTRFPHARMAGTRPRQGSAVGSVHSSASSSGDAGAAGAAAAPRAAAHHQQQQHSPSSSTSSPGDRRGAPASSARGASPRTAPTPPIDVPGRSRAQRSTPQRDSAEDENDETPRMETDGLHRQQQEGDEVNYGASPPSPQLRPTIRSTASLTNSGSPPRIVVRNLNHIQSFASEEVLTRSRHGSRRSLHGRMEGSQQYEISNMPVTDIIEMVAGLLTKITTTNDRPNQHENLHRHLPNSDSNTSASHLQTQSVLSFHGRNIPSITILSYLSRIHRYCPTTYEVFLSLLVYFDRMTEAVNNKTLRSFRSVEEAFSGTNTSSGGASSGGENNAAASLQTPPASGSVPPQDSDHESSLVDSDDEPEDPPPNHVFIVDSYNIHRLVIAGVTCASKFFSDVFYTNSRYAKVGGLPIHELNHLELQFLLLNDFRLSVPVEELEAYGSRLVEFYAREVVAQQSGNGDGQAQTQGSGQGSSQGPSQGQSQGHDALYMQNQENTET